MQIFEGILFFKAMNYTKIRDHLSAASWALAGGSVHKTDVLE